MRHDASAEGRPLLRLLLLWLSSLPARSGGAVLLRNSGGMKHDSAARNTSSAAKIPPTPTDSACDTCRGRDWAGDRRALLIWCLPAAIMLVTALVDATYLVVVWPSVLAWMGVACLLNARRCSRLHCYLTGPYFLLLGVVALLHGLDVFPLGPNGWHALLLAFVIGGAFLTYVPEWLFGRYRTSA